MSETGAAVVVAAHIAKVNIGAQGVSHGFTTGSLAFENAARQLVGIIPMPDEDAKKYGMEHVKRNYMRLEMPKNSYGSADGGAYLAKVPVPNFHTITVEPFTPLQPVFGMVQTRQERLKQELLDHIAITTGVTPNALDGLAGMKGQFKASKKTIRDVMKELVTDGVTWLRNVSKDERRTLKLSQQVTQVYEVVE
ncbi:MAG: hypothetical protein QF902_10840 [Rhodospirillales bacterium]|nr:hypothetical protein [Rhodospirillales bacterium]